MRRWGICFGPAWGASLAELIGPARQAEAAGFDRIAVGEYHNDALAWLQAFAAATERVRVATTIMSVALRHPAVAGEAVAAIRDAYGDRVELGIGLSHRRIVEDELGLRLESIGYLEEYAEAVRAVQRCTPFEGPRIRATPPIGRNRVAPGAAPVLVAALGEAAVRRAARYADGLILTWTPPAYVARMADVASAARGDGRAPLRLWLVLPSFASEDITAARRAAASTLLEYLRLPAYEAMLRAAGWDEEVTHVLAELERAGDEQVRRRLPAQLLESVSVVGGTEQLEAHLDAFGRAGVDDLIVYPLDTGEGWRPALERHLRELAPAVLARIASN
jgi:5,10-methylenetetrahydromethanopterin reductase